MFLPVSTTTRVFLFHLPRGLGTGAHSLYHNSSIPIAPALRPWCWNSASTTTQVVRLQLYSTLLSIMFAPVHPDPDAGPQLTTACEVPALGNLVLVLPTSTTTQVFQLHQPWGIDASILQVPLLKYFYCWASAYNSL